MVSVNFFSFIVVLLEMANASVVKHASGHMLRSTKRVTVLNVFNYTKGKDISCVVSETAEAMDTLKTSDCIEGIMSLE